MTRLPELHRLLVQGARRQEEQESRSGGPLSAADRSAGVRGRLRGFRGQVRRLLVPLLAFGGLLAMTTIALAASGVILTGAPVHLQGSPNPDAGDGVPVPGASRLLPLRVPDPVGGLPWGMRIVNTTRGEVCLQVGRVEDGDLGELGIDGAFHDDGRFHPLPADALPRDVFHGHFFDNVSSANTACQLAGQVSAGEHIGIESSAAEATPAAHGSRADLRDIYYGILGKDAVSVSYRVGASQRSETVVPETGAYLIVRRLAPGEQAGTGGASLGSEGRLQPAPRDGLSAITYRIDGKLCQRAPVEPPGGRNHLANPCPEPRWSHQPTRIADLHRPLLVHLQVHDRRLEGVRLSFTAPFPVTSAGAEYRIEIPGPGTAISCRPSAIIHARQAGGSGGALIALQRDIARGATVAQWISAQALFQFVPCGHRIAVRRSAAILVSYESAGRTPALLGKVTVRMPPGTRLALSSRVR
jgi:hypothetical protein